MKVQVSYKNLKHGQEVEEKINKESAKLKKLMGSLKTIKWTCYKKEGKTWADLQVIGPSFEYHASAQSPNLYKSLELAMSKLEKQVEKKKDKWKNHISRKKKPLNQMEILEPEVAWTYYDEDDFDDVA